MPKNETSMLTQVAAGVRGRIRTVGDYYRDDPGQPFGVEHVAKDEARRRFLAMEPEARQELIAQQGMDRVLDLFRKRAGGRP